MTTAQMPMLEHASVPARVTFALAVGRAALPQLAADGAGHALAQRALSEAGRWVAGAPVSAAQLTDFLMDEREQGLLLFSQRCDDPARRLAWMVLETAIAYAAWQAWRTQGELPAALVSEVDDDTLGLLCQQAADAGVPQATIDALRQRAETAAR
jgi:Immunity protein Imm6